MFSATKSGVGSTPVTTDPYFMNTVLLLNDTGTNGAQNNTFIDSSTNNFSITRNGNTTQGSFNPYEPTGYWGGYFDGTGDYLSVADNAAFALSSGAFTIECWVYFSSVSGEKGIVSKWNASNQGYNIRYSSSNGGIRAVFGGNLGIDAWNLSWTPSVGVWYHLAFVRSSNSFYVFVNGTQIGSTQTFTNSPTITTTTDVLVVGTSQTVASSDMAGYISNFRLVKGTAVYTSAFTPPTTPLTAITNTSLLCLQDNRFKDNSSNNFTITRNGDTKVTHFNPFAPTDSYTTSAYGGSGYFDGTGDYLSTPNTAALRLGAGDFTVEAWIYPSRITNTYLSAICGTYGYVSSADRGWALYLSATGYLSLVMCGSSGAAFSLSSSTITTANAWSHVAAVRNGTTVKLYLNGVQVASGTSSKDEDYSVVDFNVATVRSDNLSPATGNAGQSFQGYLSNVRVVKGTAVYTSAFTPPTTPVTAISGTSLLLNATNAGIYDATAINDMETVGNAQVSTAQAKWGSSSISFNGSNSFLKVPQSLGLFPGTTGDFTLEFWVYFTNFTGGPVIFDNRLGTYTTNLAIYCNNAGGQTVALYANSADRAVSGSLSTGTWYHMAVSRSSGTTKFFIAGTQVGSNYTDSNNYGSTSYAIGGAFNLSTNVLNGYIEDLRITLGVARYTANFTPPTAAFPTR